MFLGLLGQPCGLNLIKLGLSYICQVVMPRILSQSLDLVNRVISNLVHQRNDLPFDSEVFLIFLNVYLLGDIPQQA